MYYYHRSRLPFPQKVKKYFCQLWYAGKIIETVGNKLTCYSSQRIITQEGSARY